MSEKLSLEELMSSGLVEQMAASWLMHTRGLRLMRRMPSATRARFSLDRVMRSATVPRAARSVSWRHSSGWPKRLPSRVMSFKATPTPAK